MILLELRRRRERSDRLRGAQQLGEDDGGVELALLNRAEDAGKHFVRVGAARGAVAPTHFAGDDGSTVQLKAAAFKPGADIPEQFTCDGSNISPALSWTTPPEGTQSFSLIMEDPDAPGRTWVHWVLYDLPATDRELPEGVAPKGTLPSGARQGRNDFGKTGYGGPCPPPDRRIAITSGCMHSIRSST